MLPLLNYVIKYVAMTGLVCLPNITCSYNGENVAVTGSSYNGLRPLIHVLILEVKVVHYGKWRHIHELHNVLMYLTSISPSDNGIHAGELSVIQSMKYRVGWGMVQST